MTMLTIQSHMPAAAPDLLCMNSPLNSGLGLSAGPVNLRTYSLFSRMKLSLSNCCSCVRKASTEPIIFLPAAHVTSSFLRLVPLGAIMYMTALMTVSTAGGGVASDLSSVSAVLVRPLSAAMALMMAGSAAARSLRQDSWKAPTSVCTLDTFSSSTAAISACSSATMDSWPTRSSSSSVSFFLVSTTMDSSARVTCISATWSCASCSLISPSPSRPRSWSMLERFLASWIL
mmetsp:Transcript_55338/g.132541  ORF Transcript_55338/g.132541 Transcript_55338/m.132541 type:complete len:231 (-) Transcript_55338:1560-2252(-)